MPRGIIYQNICFYRIAMNVLYGFAYRKRFRMVNRYIQGDKVIELCFGDLLIARYCRQKKFSWTGYDLNEKFVGRAQRNKFNAVCCDLSQTASLPDADITVIMGSLYHFKEDPEHLFNLMFRSAKRVIISEPVKNLSSRKDGIGKLAAMLSDTGRGAEKSRYDKQELLSSAEDLCKKFNFTVSEEKIFKKDRIIVFDKCQTRN